LIHFCSSAPLLSLKFWRCFFNTTMQHHKPEATIISVLLWDQFPLSIVHIYMTFLFPSLYHTHATSTQERHQCVSLHNGKASRALSASNQLKLHWSNWWVNIKFLNVIVPLLFLVVALCSLLLGPLIGLL
jgi:hypothetical protein